MAKKTWRQKFAHPPAPQVETVEKTFWGMEPGDKMLISTPAEIDEYLRAIPRGETRDVATMRNDLATRHGAKVTCPLTTGIFLRISSEVALEDIAEGQDPAPFWRVVAATSPLAKKISCGPEGLLALLAKYG